MQTCMDTYVVYTVGKKVNFEEFAVFAASKKAKT